MKSLSLYNFEETLVIDKEAVLNATHTELTELQSYSIGFTELFEGTLIETRLSGYDVLKVTESKRKEAKQDTVEREFNRRMKRKTKEGIPFDMDQLLQEVNEDLIRTADITKKTFMLVVDHLNKKVMIDAPRNVAEEALQLLHTVLVDDIQFEVLMPDQAVMQKMLTSYVNKPLLVPEPIILGYHVEMGSKTEVGKKAKSSNVIIKNEPVEDSDEVKKHLASGKVVNKIQLDSDGIIFANIDNTFFINAIKFEEALKYKEDDDISASLNFLAEWQQKLPEVSKFVGILENELKNASV